MSTINGAAINWAGAVRGTAITGTNVGTLVLQDSDHAKNAEQEIIRDEEGERIARVWYGAYDTATFNYIVKAATLAAAITASKVPAQGEFVTVTSTTYAALAATTWEVVGASSKGSNTGALRITLQLEKCAGITAIAAAGA